MGSANQGRLPAVVGELRERIEEWRRTREKCGPMPDELWSAAVSLAISHGTCRIARAVRVDYGGLRRRVEQPRGGVSKRTGEAIPGFVELPMLRPSEVRAGGGARAVRNVDMEDGRACLELTSRDGARLVLRFDEPAGVDVAALADSFWRRCG